MILEKSIIYFYMLFALTFPHKMQDFSPIQTIEYQNACISYDNEFIIGENINKENLDNKYVAMASSSISLNSNKNIILAGHSIDNVFKNLHKLKINDEIKIITKNNERIYLVSEILVVNDNDIEYMEQTNTNILTLITCMNNSKKRLIIKALPK